MTDGGAPAADGRVAGTVAGVPPARRTAVLPAAVGAVAALLALSTLGLTWWSRTVQGPLGDAGATQVEQLSGREVAPLVAALVPGVTAVVVVSLLLRGWWRVGALVVAALGAGAATLSAGGTALGGRTDGASTTAVPLIATLACLVVAVCAVLAAVGAVRDARRPAPSAATSATSATSARSATSERSTPARESRAQTDAPAGPAAPAPPPEPTPADLWRELDEGRDPTGTA